jgi:hypothetical protein
VDQPTLSQLQQYLTVNTQEAQEIKGDLDKAKELLNSCNERLNRLFGRNEQSDEKKPLRTYIKNVLHNANEPLTIKEIAELVLESGYKSTSKHFRNVVQQTIAADSEFKRKTRPKARPSRYAVEEV